MTTTLDSKALNAIVINESLEIIGPEYEAWDTTTHKAVKKLNVLGVFRRWTIGFSEDNVAWTASNAVSFQNTCSAGSAVTFAITDEVRVLSTTVKIKKVDIGPIQDLAGHNIRRVTLELLETS